MIRPVPFFVLGLLMTASAGPGATQAEKADKVAEQLDAAKKEYRAASDAAATKLLEALAKQEMELLAKKKLPPQKVGDLLKDLDKQKAAFQADPTQVPQANDPLLQTLRDGRTKYDLVMKDARKKCEQAFDDAANAYRGQGKINLFMLVLAEKVRFFEAPSPSYAGWYKDSAGSKVYEFTPKGDVLHDGNPNHPSGKGAWTADGDKCHLLWDNKWGLNLRRDGKTKVLSGYSHDERGKEVGKLRTLTPIPPPKK